MNAGDSTTTTLNNWRTDSCCQAVGTIKTWHSGWNGNNVPSASFISPVQQAQRALTVLSITTQTRAGRDLMAWAGVAGRAAAELKMDKRKKLPGGAEKLRLKKLKSLEVEAAKYSKLTDLLVPGSPPQQVLLRRETSDYFPSNDLCFPYVQPRQVQSKSSWSVQGESQTNSDSPKTAPPEREKAVESEEYVSPKTGSPEREKAVESEEYVSPKTGSPEREKAVESEEYVSPKTGSPEREKAVESEEYVSPKTGSPEREKAVESEEYVSPKTGSPEREKAVESEECVSPKTGSPEREKAVESEECVSPKTLKSSNPVVQKVFCSRDGTSRRWLTYCPESHMLYCFICMAFGKRTDSSLFISGMSDWRHIHQRTEEHKRSSHEFGEEWSWLAAGEEVEQYILVHIHLSLALRVLLT
ncbi:hypothetical protein F7725_001549 [Dissostichus mawsoni]|uniref:Uncharacterized protein n=1 Tax=Dissostichus mawsoni TaxID=36200 RepID=A0A7J5Y032_DISMA|nr:hypothetical protein F7725_001549 [Dissostichus mawsoni]